MRMHAFVLLLVFVCLLPLATLASRSVCETSIFHPDKCARDLVLARRLYSGDQHLITYFYMPEFHQLLELGVSFGAPATYVATPPGAYRWQLGHPSLYIQRAPPKEKLAVSRVLHPSENPFAQTLHVSSRGRRVSIHAQLVAHLGEVAPTLQEYRAAVELRGFLFLGPHSVLWDTFTRVEVTPYVLRLLDGHDASDGTLQSVHEQLPWTAKPTAVRLHCTHMGYISHHGADDDDKLDGRTRYRDGCTTMNAWVDGRAHTLEVALDLESTRSYLPSDLYVQFYDHRGERRTPGVDGAPATLAVYLPGSPRALTIDPSQMRYYLNLHHDQVVLGSDVLGLAPRLAYDHAANDFYIEMGAILDLVPLRVFISALVLVLAVIQFRWMTSDHYSLLAMSFRVTATPAGTRGGPHHPTVKVRAPPKPIIDLTGDGRTQLTFEALAVAVGIVASGAVYPVLPAPWLDVWIATVVFVALQNGIMIFMMIRERACHRARSSQGAIQWLRENTVRTIAHTMSSLGSIILTLLPSSDRFVMLIIMGIFAGFIVYFIAHYLHSLLYISDRVKRIPGDPGSVRRWWLFIVAEIAALVVYGTYVVILIAYRTFSAGNSTYSTLTIVILTLFLITTIVAISVYFVEEEVKTEARLLIQYHAQAKKSA